MPWVSIVEVDGGMKGIIGSRCGLGLATISAMTVLSMVLPTVIAAKNEWHLSINGGSTPRGWYCPSAMSGDDDIFGTFEWDYSLSDPGFADTFEYSYDGAYWIDVNPDPTWVSNRYYLFDFTTDWPQQRQIGENFEIVSDYPGTVDYYCQTP